MLSFIAQRLVQSVLVMLTVALIAFSMFRYVGDPVASMVGQDTTPEQRAELREQLRATEYDRALEVWKKRFSAKPEDRAVYAKQARFLASRGFAHDVIRRILGEGDED